MASVIRIEESNAVVKIQEDGAIVRLSNDRPLVKISSIGLPGPNGVGVPTGGTAGQVLAKNSGTDYDTEWVDDSGGGIPGGSNTHVQFNDAGAFAGSAKLIWDKVTQRLTVVGNSTNQALGCLYLKADGGAFGCGFNMDAAPSGGRIYSFSATGSGTFITSGFAIYDSTASQYRLHITSTGNVGIGTVTTFGNAAGSKLAVKGNCAIGDAYWTTTAVPANSLAVAGMLGVGTNIPTEKVHISGSSNQKVKVVNTTSGMTTAFGPSTTNGAYPRAAFFIGRASGTPVNTALWVIPDSGTTQVTTTLEALTNEDTSTTNTKRIGMRATTTGGLLYLARGAGSDGDTPLQISSNGLANVSGGITIAAPSSNIQKVGFNTSSPGGQVHITSGSSAIKTLVLKAAASQAANLTEWQNSSGTILNAINSIGNISLGASSIPSTSRDTKLYIVGNGEGVFGRTNFIVENTKADSAASFQLKNNIGATLNVQMSCSNYASGALANRAGFGCNGALMTFSTDGDIASGGTNAILFGAGGYDPSNLFVKYDYTHRVGIHVTTPTASLDVSSKISTDTVLRLRGVAGQSGNFITTQNSSGVELLTIRSDGTLKPTTQADSATLNNSIYFSTNSNSLTYKTSTGSLRRLHTYGVPKTQNYFLPTNISQDSYTKDITVVWTTFAFDNGYLLN